MSPHTFQLGFITRLLLHQVQSMPSLPDSLPVAFSLPRLSFLPFLSLQETPLEHPPSAGPTVPCKQVELDGKASLCPQHEDLHMTLIMCLAAISLKNKLTYFHLD